MTRTLAYQSNSLSDWPSHEKTNKNDVRRNQTRIENSATGSARLKHVKKQTLNFNLKINCLWISAFLKAEI